MNINSMIPPPSSPAVDQNGYLAPEWWKFLLTLLSRTGGPGMHPDTQDAAEQAAMSALANVNTGAITAQQALAALAGLEPLPASPLFPTGRIADLEMPDKFWPDGSLQARIADQEAQDRPVMDARLAARITVLEDAEWLARMDSQLAQRLAELAQKLADMDAMLMEWRPTVPAAAFVLPVVGPWAAPTLTNGWVNFGAGYSPAGYFKDPWGVVHLRGMVNSGAINSAVFTLPAGYFPGYAERHAITSNGVFGAVEISTGGAVVPITGTNSNLTLDGITFRAI